MMEGMDATQTFEQKARSNAFMHAGIVKALYSGQGPDVAREMLEQRLGRHNPWLPAAQKSIIPAATPAGWGSVVAEPSVLADAFIARLRPRTVLGQMGEAARRVPFDRSVGVTTSGSTAEWAGSGRPLTVSAMAFDRKTLPVRKMGVVSVVANELLRESAADPIVLNTIEGDLIVASAEGQDGTFLSTEAEIAGVQPPGLLYGVSAIVSGGSPDVIEAAVEELIRSVRGAEAEAPFFVTSRWGALHLATRRDIDGERIFPNVNLATGGDIFGIPLLLSKGAEHRLILIDAAAIAYADAGVEIGRSSQTALQMVDDPTNASDTGTATTLLSLFQSDSTALKAVRFVNWTKGYADAASYIELAAGSPS
jgi:HK97 family phage major capsid protein